MKTEDFERKNVFVAGAGLSAQEGHDGLAWTSLYELVRFQQIGSEQCLQRQAGSQIIVRSTFHKVVVVSPFIRMGHCRRFCNGRDTPVHFNSTVFTMAAPKYTSQIT